MKKAVIGFSIGIAVLSVLLILFLATGLWKVFFNSQAYEDVRTKVVIPQEAGQYSAGGQTGQTAWEESLSTKIPLEDGEIVIAVLNKESEERLTEDQFVVYRNTANTGPLFITLLSYDENTRKYKRMWNEPTAATRPETITLFNQDLLGDRNNCIIIAGMNSRNEHTMTIFRRSTGQPQEQPYKKIAELQIDGSITIQETTRTLAYQQGMTRGQSFNIAAYSHDSASANILDQIETIYSFNSLREQYEQTNVSRILGSQIEQRRLRELLSGRPGVFENFINDLWYYVSPEGTIDANQYLYFDPQGKEIIFFGDEAQQVFRWQTSTPTRLGIYIRSQNISISTLSRLIDIELESLDRIRLRVHEDVRLRITANTTWDGSYRRARVANVRNSASQIKSAVDAVYDSSWGRLQFFNSGEYTINSSGNTKRGHYVFYKVENNELLEMRPAETTEENRMVYKIENLSSVLILSRVRVGTNGIQDLLEPAVTLTPVNQ
ncbi:MAG: pallilysin-related adhesin [Treponema sp.]|nr:pallilysin-related adhesin [Treponema sp.]